MKTELEKAAEILQKDKYGIFISKDADVKGQLVIDTARAAFLSGMTEGVKWQQERSYSEEDLKQFAWQCVANFLSNKNNAVEQNLVEVIMDRNNLEFEQFKKK
jgi:hypothetical protein